LDAFFSNSIFCSRRKDEQRLFSFLKFLGDFNLEKPPPNKELYAHPHSSLFSILSPDGLFVAIPLELYFKWEVGPRLSRAGCETGTRKIKTEPHCHLVAFSTHWHGFSTQYEQLL
jgi:hypothetical protein